MKMNNSRRATKYNKKSMRYFYKVYMRKIMENINEQRRTRYMAGMLKDMVVP